MGYFPHRTRLVLDKKITDHHHILLLEHKVDYGAIPFRTFYSWFNMDGCDDVVRDFWLQDMSSNNLWVMFKKKLQNLKSNICVWNASSCDQLGNKRKELQDLLESIDAHLMVDIVFSFHPGTMGYG